jgi:RHS repeat-associated protein
MLLLRGSNSTPSVFLPTTGDAQGNVLSVYKRRKDTVTWQEVHLYGSSRLGIWQPNQRLTPSVDTSKKWQIREGQKRYELTNHLGNVLVTISDRRQGAAPVSSQFTYYEAVVITATDYYPFGMSMPNRDFKQNTEGYRYSFNGKEDDNEWGVQDYGMRIYDELSGRFYSVDPIGREYPELTPYQFASNRPIDGIDLDGLEWQEIKDAYSWAAKKTGQLVVATVKTVVIATSSPVGQAKVTKAAIQGALKTARNVGVMGSGIVKILYGTVTKTPINVNQEEFREAAHEIGKEIVRTGAMAVVTAGAGEVVQAVGRVKVARTPTPKPKVKQMSDFEGMQLTTEEASKAKGGGVTSKAKNFDEAREKAFENAGITDPNDVQFTQVDPVTGTVVEFRSKKTKAEVNYDNPHADMDPVTGHDQTHIGWQKGKGKAKAKGNITYPSENHPARTTNKGEGYVDPH